MADFKQKFSDYVSYFNNELEKFTNDFNDKYPSLLGDAMAYAVLDGGKRVRPVLCFATAEMLGVKKECVLPFAMAIELIHSYSLVHDDLPAMDNDDYRRGKLSTHKKFGEAFGILAGDGLLNLAFEISLSKENLTPFDIDAIRIIADYAGSNGMIKGQVLDLESENNKLTGENVLFDIIDNKTSKLITCPLLVSSCVAKKRYFEELKEFGIHLGRLFQIVDDVMDEEGDLKTIGKTPHKDKEVDKLTSIKTFGLDGAKERAKQEYLICKNILKGIPDSEFLSDFTDLMYIRKS